MMPEWGWSLIGAMGAPLLAFLWQGFLKRENTVAFGRRVGKLISIFLKQKLGVKGSETLEARFQSTAEDFVTGLRQGLAEG